MSIRGSLGGGPDAAALGGSAAADPRGFGNGLVVLSETTDPLGFGNGFGGGGGAGGIRPALGIVFDAGVVFVTFGGLSFG